MEGVGEKTLLTMIKEKFVVYLFGIIAVIIIILLIYYYYKNSSVGQATDGLSNVLSSINSGLSSAVGAVSKGFNTLKGGVPRGVGKPIHACPDDKNKDAGLCYDKCRDGYNGVGPVCWLKNCPPNTIDIGAVCTKKTEPAKKANCPSGMRDDGTSCWLDTYGRGTGRAPGLEECPPGWNDDGLTCRKPITCASGLDFFTKGCSGGEVISKNLKNCNSDEEKNGLLCYPKCKEGFHSVGCCLCEPNGGPGIKKTLMDRQYCPPGYKNVAGICWAECSGETIDTGAQCLKKSYGRGAGKPLGCASNEDYDSGLCYPKCKEVQGVKDALAKNPSMTFKPIGPMCWPEL